MIRLQVLVTGQESRTLLWQEPILTIGRAATNDVMIPADNVSGQHAQVTLHAGRYVFRDLKSTNGSMVVRRDKKFPIKGEHLEMPLEVGDRVYLASPDYCLVIDAIIDDLEPPEDSFESTILAEAEVRPAAGADLESSLREDSEALHAAVRLARELADLDSTLQIAELACASCLQIFPRADRAAFMVPEGNSWVAMHFTNRNPLASDMSGTYSSLLPLYKRCLTQRKGFLFLMEHNRLQAVATMIAPMDVGELGGLDKNQVLLCCPLVHNEQCFGFLQVEASLAPGDRNSLTRRDLSLGTLMSHLIAARLNDLETQSARLKLARKATAGFMAATVGHCFKNLLFVPMSLGKMLPICLEQGKMDEVNWMLARNGVAIRYLDILSNEFAAASKDPTEGFEPCDVAALISEVAQILGGIAPDRVDVGLGPLTELPKAAWHGAAVRRLLLNLALNSVDAVFGVTKPAQKGRIDLEATYHPTQDELTLLVRDNGPGIPDPILKNLREINRQVQESADALGQLQDIAERVRSTKDQGLKEHYGLGFLFVCQTVHQHQGRLEIESRPGRGTTFRITLPCSRQNTNGGAPPTCCDPE